MWYLDVKNDIMQLKSLHNFFKNGLIGYYPKEEIDAFFYRICAKQLKLKRIDITLQSEMIVAAQTFEYFPLPYGKKDGCKFIVFFLLNFKILLGIMNPHHAVIMVKLLNFFSFL